MSHNSENKIAFNYFGGKYTWIKYLYQYFPEGINHLVDLFAGSMVVSINYNKARIIKTANEINGDITNFFEVLRDNECELLRRLRLTPVSELDYRLSWEPVPDKIEQARRFYVRSRQSFFGLGMQRQNKGWHMAKSHVHARAGETVTRWYNGVEKLHAVADVIRQDFQITNWDYQICIDKTDTPDTFFYCDPPYSRRSRKSFNDYKFEFTDDDHRTLSEILHNIKGKAMVSGYDCSLMNELYGDWTKIMFPIKKNNIRSSEVQEVIWINYEPYKGLFK